MLASELIERVFNEWLYRAGVNRPAFDILDADITNNALTLDTRQLQPYSADGGLIEIDSELILYQSAAKDTPIAGKTRLTLNERGFWESAAINHVAGTKILKGPDFPRVTVFNAIRSIYGMLFPWGLYDRAVDASKTFSTSAPVAMPADCKRVISVRPRVSTTGRWRSFLQAGIEYDVMYDTGGAPEIQFYGGASTGATLRIVYARDFTRPAAEADNLSALAVPVSDDLQPYLSMAVAGYLLQGEEPEHLNIEEIRRAVAAQGAQMPAGVFLNVGQALLGAFRQIWLEAQARRLDDFDSTSFEFVP